MGKEETNKKETIVSTAPPSLLKTTLAGGAGGAALVLVGHPLDTIKVRIQTMEVKPGVPPPYTGTFDCAQKTLRAEGVRGLYKGMAAPLTGVTPMYAACFLGYGIGRKIFTTEDDYKNLNLLRIGLAGATSGVFTTPILTPIERFKCLLQIQGQSAPGVAPKYSGPMDCLKKLYAEGGLASVNRGFLATMARDSLGSLFYFSSYEYIKRKLTPEGKSGPNPFGTMFAGGMAGIFNWLVALPIDTLKSRYQVAPEGAYLHGIRSVFKEIMAKEGPRALWRGMGPVMIRAFPANAACFLGYESALKFLNWLGMP